ncbi:MAG: VWA domain-containing protein [Gammaproteobacteria bacterium]
MARKRLNVFNLSFLDIMSCGFGAVVLFYMIITAQVAVRAEQASIELLNESSMLEENVLNGRKDLVRLRNSAESSEREKVFFEGEARRLQEIIEELREQLSQYDGTSLATVDSIEKLKSDIERLEEEKKRLAAAAQEENEETGQRVRAFVGQGNRQYLTGLQMGGERVLIMVDASASMLGRTYVNVVRYRNMPDRMKVRSPKWRRAVRTVEWLTAQLEPGTKYQIMTFNEDMVSVLPDSKGAWLDVSNAEELEDAVSALDKVVPEKGTSLFQAFSQIGAMDPLPDNVFLITDGLPTQGKNPPREPEMIRPDRRVGYFNQALGALPDKVPVNVLLFPMDGDPDAAGYMWQLALRSRGSMMSPSEDWP